MSAASSTSLKQPDVLSIALFIAAAAHAVVLLGVSFQPFLDDMRTPPALEVILVQNADKIDVDDAAYLAQASQDGGGDTDDNTRPSAPFSSPLDAPTDGLAQAPITASAPAPSEQSDEEVLKAVFSDDTVATQESTDNTQEINAPEDDLTVQQNMDIARLTAEIAKQQEAFAKRPKKRHINARTKETAAADYMFRWVESVERVGNLNYPDEARRNALHGALILVVGIHKNGDLESITIDESSGHKILDDAAIRIVEMAAPFAQMTGQLAEETDILYIVRTWEFKKSNEVTSY